MPGKHSLQGIPRPDRIILNRGDGSDEETISSTGYYHVCCSKPPVKMSTIDQMRAYAIVKQFNGLSQPSPHLSAYHPPCCNFRDSYFDYQGVRVPINYAPQLEEIFNKYHQLSPFL